VNAGFHLSLVVPCYNEEQRVPDFLTAFQSFATRFEDELFALFPRIEIVIVNDGSIDSTEKKLKFLIPQLKRVYHRGIVTARVENLKFNQGKGAAVRAGV
jgi:glycosyltransferase involved in cell wall biosynthesis